jgi:hypothetical protein
MHLTEQPTLYKLLNIVNIPSLSIVGISDRDRFYKLLGSAIGKPVAPKFGTMAPKKASR